MKKASPNHKAPKALNHKQMVRDLRRAGFQTVRDKGKHMVMRHPDKSVRQLSISRGSDKRSVSRKHFVKHVPAQHTEVTAGRCLDCEKEFYKKSGKCPWCGSHNVQGGSQ